MDIFSATSKHIESAQPAPKAEAAGRTRQVETTNKVTQSAGESKQTKNDITQKLNDTVDKLNKSMEDLGTNVQFGFNDKIDVMFVNVVERSTGKPIRKIPTEEAMKLSEKMQEIVGTIFDKKG
jgi:flagellar protein FlaG